MIATFFAWLYVFEHRKETHRDERTKQANRLSAAQNGALQEEKESSDTVQY